MGSKAGFKLPPGVTKDFLFNISAIAIMNIVTQLVYSYLGRKMGAEAFGNVLYLIAVATIFANPFGMAVNNTRLIIKTKFSSKNGDYNSLLAIFGIVCCVAAIPVLYFLHMLTPLSAVLYSVFMILTMLRYYSDVEFRLILNYRRYFVYYMLLSAGYLAGLLLFNAWSNWYIVLITGELIAVLFVVFGGTIYRKPFECSEHRKTVWRMAMTVAASYVTSVFFLNLDRVVLQNFLGGAAVTIFYAASVLGRIVAMVTGPLTGVMISHLANFKVDFTKKLFTKALLLAVVLSLVCFVGCVLLGPWAINFLYPEVAGEALPLLVIATLGQILCFTAAMLLAILLRFCHEKYQLIIQIIYGAIYVALAIPLTIQYNIIGFAIATLVASVARFLIVVVVGYVDANRNERRLRNGIERK